MAERVRLRWVMSTEARLLAALTVALVVFGLATLYSASALVALQQGRPGSYFFARQGEGVLAGLVLFALAAKWDAERLERWAWPLMYISVALMLLTVLPFTESLAPRVNGSRRFVLGTALQPSELGKLAVVVDDAAQGVTHVIRGADLRDVTSIHRLLQALLGLASPTYRHHRLLTDAAGRRLAKRDGAPTIAALRAGGATPQSVLRELDALAAVVDAAMPAGGHRRATP